jgi:hypothetical protein
MKSPNDKEDNRIQETEKKEIKKKIKNIREKKAQLRGCREES